jgi:hypothetical protein
VYADVVILADGVNSTLARKAGFHDEIEAGNVALAVKEILFMPEETIQQRFNIEEEGVVIEMIGKDHRRHDGHRLPLHQQGLADDRRRLHAVRLQGRTEPHQPYALLEKMKATPASPR